MKRNIIVAALMLLSAMAGAVAERLLGGAASAPAGHPPASSIAAAVASPNAAQPAAPESGDAPAAEPAPADLEGIYTQALGDRSRSIENFFIDGGLISGHRAALLRSDDDYERFVDYLQSYAGAASEEHIAQLQQGLANQRQILDGSVAITDLACGPTLCTVTVNGRDEADIDDYLTDALRAPGEPVYVAMRVPMQTRGGAGLRLLFSVDPSVKGALPG